MSLTDHIGRLCVKLAGRDAGRSGVIVSVIDRSYVVVTGPPSLTGLRRRKVNIAHLALTPYKISIPVEASDEEVIKALEENGLKEKMGRGLKI
jgi:large subunit ribosomal protein L14e